MFSYKLQPLHCVPCSIVFCGFHYTYWRSMWLCVGAWKMHQQERRLKCTRLQCFFSFDINLNFVTQCFTPGGKAGFGCRKWQRINRFVFKSILLIAPHFASWQQILQMCFSARMMLSHSLVITWNTETIKEGKPWRMAHLHQAAWRYRVMSWAQLKQIYYAVLTCSLTSFIGSISIYFFIYFKFI